MVRQKCNLFTCQPLKSVHNESEQRQGRAIQGKMLEREKLGYERAKSIMIPCTWVKNDAKAVLELNS
jgi:hypothetical protein